MPRVKLLKDCKQGKKDAVVTLSPNEAFGLIDSGVAIVTKDMVESDYKITSDEVQADGDTTKLRPNK